MMKTHEDDLKTDEEWSSPQYNYMVPRDRKPVMRACIIALGVVFYGTIALAGALIAAFILYGFLSAFKGL